MEEWFYKGLLPLPPVSTPSTSLNCLFFNELLDELENYNIILQLLNTPYLQLKRDQA